MNQANLWDLLMMNILIFTICVFQYRIDYYAALKCK